MFLPLNWRERVMANKYDPEARKGVIRLFRKRRYGEPKESPTASFCRVNELTGTRPPSARSASDQRLLAEVPGAFYANYQRYGIRKVWQELKHRRAAGRDQVARIMRSAGLRGTSRLKRVRTTYAYGGVARSPDPMQHN